MKTVNGDSGRLGEVGKSGGTTLKIDGKKRETSRRSVTLTVLGLVRFLASVSQLLRWLYVLLLRDNTKTEVIVEAVRDNVTPPHRSGGHKRTPSSSSA